MDEPPPVNGIYHLDGLIGRGGVGRVYRARYTDRRAPVQVALKLLDSELLPDATARAQFIRSTTRLAADLQHPHLATVYDVGEVEDTVYIVLQLVVGPNLAQAQQGPLSLSRTVTLVEQLGEALATLHACGVIWADPSPMRQVLLESQSGSRDWAVLPDPWLRHLIEQARTGSQRIGTAPYIGNPIWLAPEQLSDRPQLQPQTDVYQLGEIAFTLLTGQPPAYKGMRAGDILHAKMHGIPPDHLRALRPDLSQQVAEVISAALALDPLRRPPDPRAFSTELRAAAGLEASDRR